MYLLSNNLVFPPVNLANEDGILAIGGDLSVDRLLLAYKSGIFPWYNPGEPIIWYSPDPRMVLFPKDLKISKSMKQVIKKGEFKITYNKNFKEVISNCKTIERNDQGGTWITDEMQQAYIELHKKGIAKSVEVWRENELVGGLYGVDLGTIFCGESMFSKVSNTSKLAFIYLVQKLETENYKLIDCQVYNNHLANLGAEEISRESFLKYLN
ncbi:leucyl/phenylalanyl-tRNA--protein transferase [uncultured Lutibacter sp.]|uniref:leucyl/phenylalanyl-tRNA--protein transferase n=1 Tax=uncultured Lutibacter sp. TaxID=437739 RepID=UPI00261ECC23|nr:leucyl/phenylalanyl-tRNA--protein transferase [uncultured Lutibacter sp.]